MLQFACPNCHQAFSAAEEIAGQAVACPHCGQHVTVPFPSVNTGPIVAPTAAVEEWLPDVMRAEAVKPPPPPVDLRPISPRPQDVPPPVQITAAAPPPGPNQTKATSEQDERSMAMLCHLLGIVTGFIGPLIIWLIKKDQSRLVDDQGKEALNFHITLLVYSLCAVPIVIILALVTCGFGGFLGFFLLFGIGIYGTVMQILAGIDANKGVRYRYPATIRIIQ
jgi:uncharacterized Tic20 family protein